MAGLADNVDNASLGKPRVFTTDAPEYTSKNSGIPQLLQFTLCFWHESLGFVLKLQKVATHELDSGCLTEIMIVSAIRPPRFLTTFGEAIRSLRTCRGVLRVETCTRHRTYIVELAHAGVHFKKVIEEVV